MDAKILGMVEGDSFNFSAFLEFCINFFLKLNPNLLFFSCVNQILNECQIPSEFQEPIRDKITKIENSNMLLNELHQQNSKTPFQR